MIKDVRTGQGILSDVNTCGGLHEKYLPEARLFEDLVLSWCLCVRRGDYGMWMGFESS